MSCATLDNEGLHSLAKCCLAKVMGVRALADSLALSVSDIHLYVALGAINLQPISNDMLANSPVTPLQMAKVLNINARKAARFAAVGTANGLLVRERGGDRKSVV